MELRHGREYKRGSWCLKSLIERGYAAIPIMPGSKVPGYRCAGLWVPLPKWQQRKRQHGSHRFSIQSNHHS